MDKQYNGLQRAISSVGSVGRFATAIGVTHSVVAGWLKKDGVEAPPEARPEVSGIRTAVEKAGSQAELARALGVTPQSVQLWLHQGFVPMQRAQEIENTYGVPRIDLVSAKVRNAMGAGGEL